MFAAALDRCYFLHRFDEAFPSVVGVAADVVKEVVKYSPPVAFGSESARYFQKFLAKDWFVRTGVKEGDPHSAGFAVRVERFHNEDECEAVGLWHVQPSHILADLLVCAHGLDTDVFAKDVAAADALVGLRDERQVVRHDRLAEAHADVVLLLVGNDELVPLVEIGAELVLAHLEPFAGEFGECEVNPQPQNLFGIDEFGEEGSVDVHF